MKTHVPDKILQSKQKLGTAERDFYFSKLEFGGETYTNLMIHKSSGGPDNNVLGLRFLARNLVTLNFPKQMMYLKKTSVGPVVAENKKTNSIP